MGGADKGWIEYAGTPLIEHVIAKLRPQVGQLIIVANRNIDRYRQLGIPVIQDQISGFQGPLAGIHSALQTISTPLALIVPTDAPLLPTNLLEWLSSQTSVNETLGHPVLSHDGLREQPLFGLYPKSLGPALQTFLAGGNRRLMQWCRENQAHWVDFSTQNAAFANINTPAHLLNPEAGK